MTHDLHDTDRLTDLVDGRLSPAAAAEVRQHVEGCAACRGELTRLEAVRARLRHMDPGPDAPASLSQAIAAALDREDNNAVASQPGSARGWWLAAAAVLLAAVGWWWLRPAPAGPVETAYARFEEIEEGGLPQGAWTTTEPAVLQGEFGRAAGTPPGIRVIDLAMMGWSLEGGDLVRTRGPVTARFVYHDANGRRMLCQMYEGDMTDLPPASDVREHRGFTFHVYERDDVTLVFWREGRLVCVLAARLPRATVVQLAFDKAMAPG